jgi:predicted DNA-binding protein (MmcQ/YjbR family)
MLIEELRSYLSAGQRVNECAPYGHQTWVYKVDNDVFALLSHMDQPPHLTLKCDPDRALFLRSMYDSIQPSMFMNRRHWNTITLDDRLDDDTIQALIDESYALVDQRDCSSFHFNDS